MNPTQGLSLFQLVIASTMATLVNVELFNFDKSVTKIYNPANQPGGSQQFHPVAPNPTPLVLSNGDPAGKSFAFAFVVGNVQTYTSAATTGSLPAGFNSNGITFFDENGMLNYVPGYVNGVLDTGKVTVNSLQTNYRHIFEVSSKSVFDIAWGKLTTKEGFISQQDNQITYIQSNTVAAQGSVPVQPSAAKTSQQNLTNIIEFPMNFQISPKAGLVYGINPQIAGPISNSVQLSLYFKPRTANMLQLI